MTKTQILYNSADDNSIDGARLIDESIIDDKISPLAGISAEKLRFDTPTPGLVRSVQAKLEDRINVKDFGAIGDGVTDDTNAFLDAVAYIRSGAGKILYVPSGNYKLTAPMPTGSSFGIVGDSMNNSMLRPQGFTGYLFNFTDNFNYQPICDIRVIGTDYYTGPSFLRNPNGFYGVIYNIYIQNLENGINLNFAFSVWMNNLRIIHVANPIALDVANGTEISNVYIQRYTGNGIFIDRSGAPRLTNIICEYGDGGNTTAGILLRACASAVIDNYYAEGGSAMALFLTFRNGVPCSNTYIRNCWITLNGPILFDFAWAQGTTLENVYLLLGSGSNSEQVIRFGRYEGFPVFAPGPNPVYVSNIYQIDRDTRNSRANPLDKPLIPISNRNQFIYVMKPFPMVGNGTSEDGSNLANHTIKDINGLRPRLYTKPTDYRSNTASGLTCSGSDSNYGSNSPGITIQSTDYGSFRLIVEGTITTSSGAAAISKFKAINTTTGDFLETNAISLGASGSQYTLSIFVNVRPGKNKVSLAITREQSGGGTNTFTVSDYAID